MATQEDIGLAAARVFPSHDRLYEAATTGGASAEIALSVVVGADAKAIGETQMLAIQFSTKTHIKFLNATGQDTADTSDPYFVAGSIEEGFIPRGSTHIVIWPTSSGRVCIWEASR